MLINLGCHCLAGASTSSGGAYASALVTFSLSGPSITCLTTGSCRHAHSSMSASADSNVGQSLGLACLLLHMHDSWHACRGKLLHTIYRHSFLWACHKVAFRARFSAERNCAQLMTVVLQGHNCKCFGEARYVPGSHRVSPSRHTVFAEGVNCQGSCVWGRKVDERPYGLGLPSVGREVCPEGDRLWCLCCQIVQRPCNAHDVVSFPGLKKHVT